MESKEYVQKKEAEPSSNVLDSFSLEPWWSLSEVTSA